MFPPTPPPDQPTRRRRSLAHRGRYFWPNDAVARVEYRINGNLRGEATSAPWATTNSVPTPLEDGMHQLTAQAFDRSGRRSDIRTRTIISAHTPPTIEIDGPETASGPSARSRSPCARAA